MRYQGRSPINDVVRSVVLGAAMISPLVLDACSSATPVPKPPDPDPNANNADGGAPDNGVVRPRGNDPNNMPTRGFSGAGRARRA